MKRSTKLILGIILTIVLVFPIFKMQSSAVENNEGKSEVKQNGNQQTEQLLQSDLEETTKFVQTLTCNKTGLREGEDITIDINISGSQHTASEFEGYLNYDKEVLSYKDGVANNGWSLLLFDSLESDEEAEGVIEISRENSDEVLAEGSIVSLTFTVLKDTEDTIVKLYDSWMADTNNISYSEDTQITLLSKANDGGDDDDDDKEKLYLKSDIYQIGENNEYVDGDKYIIKVQEKTTVKDFINNCNTNGIPVVKKVDNTDTQNEELVGTGMKLNVTKEDEEISLIIIVVQDVTGDGLVTTEDLSKLVADLTGETALNEIEMMASDMDGDKKNTASDLSDMISKLTK